MARNQSTSFLPFGLCPICKINHNLGAKHVYTNQHQKKLQIVLNKSALKVKEAKMHLLNVEVHDQEWKEKMTTFWCYFCESEVTKHRENNTLMISYLGVVHHFADSKHYEAVKNFLKINRKSAENIEKYSMKKAELISFLQRIPDAEARYMKKMEILNERHISQIKEVESKRIKLMEEVKESGSVGNPASASHSKIMQPGSFNVPASTSYSKNMQSGLIDVPASAFYCKSMQPGLVDVPASAYHSKSMQPAWVDVPASASYSKNMQPGLVDVHASASHSKNMQPGSNDVPAGDFYSKNMQPGLADVTTSASHSKNMQPGSNDVPVGTFYSKNMQPGLVDVPAGAFHSKNMQPNLVDVTASASHSKNMQPGMVNVTASASHSKNMKRSEKTDVKSIPPWLRPDDDTLSTSNTNTNRPVIGPTLQDLEKHVTCERKKLLPSKRIGAKFNHKASTSSKWLPSFGKVWNQGRRKQSEMQYRHQKRKLNEEIR